MKKLLFLLLLSGSLQAQERTEEYCIVVGTQKLMSSKVVIEVDYGQDKTFWKQRGDMIKDEQGKAQSFNSLVDALNYMNAQGWEFINAFPISNNYGNVYNVFMKRKIK